MNENATYTAICSGDGESRNCSGQIHYVFSVSDHVKYFGTTVSLFGINGCVPTKDNGKKKKKKKHKNVRTRLFEDKISRKILLRIPYNSK